MPSNVIRMIDHKDDARVHSVEGMLQDALEDVGKRGAFEHGKKAIVICLDDANDSYGISWIQAGMKVSEIISLLETTKAKFVDMLRGLE